VFIDLPRIYTPDVSMSYDYQDGDGPVKTDYNGDAWTIICSEAVVTYTDVKTDFMIESQGSTAF
jgi:hypothetical protein